MARPEQVPHGWMHGRRFRLTKTYTHVEGFRKGDIVKAVMVSRLGDVGVTKDLKAEYGYGLRVEPNELDPLDVIPATICLQCFYELAAHKEGCCLSSVFPK